jgi:hypothetical protein
MYSYNKQKKMDTFLERVLCQLKVYASGKVQCSSLSLLAIYKQLHCCFVFHMNSKAPCIEKG